MRPARKKLASYLLTFFVIISLNFALARLMPGNPFLHLSGEGGEIFESMSSDQVAYYQAYYGLDKPLLTQYTDYLRGLVQGDLGFSYYYKTPVLGLVLRRALWSFFLTFFALVLSFALGILLGSYSAWHRGDGRDRVLYLIMTLTSEIPPFLLGMALLLVFAARWQVFPLAGAMAPFTGSLPLGEKILDILHHAALPIMTLTLVRLGGVYILVRNALIGVLSQDYIRTAQAKGLKERRIRYRHGLRNALLPIFTRLTLQVATMMGSTILVENVFAYPGLGSLMQSAVQVRDYPLLQGIFLILALGVMGANFLADQAYKKLDPRVKG
ncbi:MAG: ABC transporter permease [Tissierellia bacterium]|nr:ABC transporter permease [Tissierellia bacterium]